MSDNHGGTSSNTLTVTINGTNDAPAIAAAATSVTEDIQLPTSGTLPAPSDPDRGDTIAFVPQNGMLGHYGSLTLGADGSYSYTLNNNLYAVQSLSAPGKRSPTPSPIPSRTATALSAPIPSP